MRRDRINFFYLNVGHFYDHFFLLIFATAAATILTREWDVTYGELITFGTPGFIAFGVCTIPAGWLADKWSRHGMMVIFFIGIGLSSIFATFANSPLQISLALLAIGVFAAIYHPVGLAMVVEGRTKTGIPLAINGVFGNFGVAAAALVTGYFIDTAGWRAAFLVPGAIAVATGVAYAVFIRNQPLPSDAAKPAAPDASRQPGQATAIPQRTLIRLFVIILFSTAVGGLVFQSTTFALPKIFDERLPEIAPTATLVGWYAFLVFSLAAFAQLVVGYLVDRHSIRTVFAVVAGLQAVLFGIMQQLSGVLALLVAIGFMLVVFGQIPINDVLVARITRGEWRSRVYAIRYVMTFSVMALTLPVIAVVHAGSGFPLLFLILTAAAAVIFCAVLALPRHVPLAGVQPETSPAE